MTDVVTEMTEELKRFLSMTGSVDPGHVDRDRLIQG